MPSKSIYVAANGKISFFFYGWVVFHSTHTHTHTHRGPKSIKSEMKKEKLEPTPQKYKGSWETYEQLYSNDMDNLEEMEECSERYNLPRLNQEEMENMNRPITSNEIELVI